MADLSNWAFPPEMQPNAEELRFDLEAALDSMVLLRSEFRRTPLPPGSSVPSASATAWSFATMDSC